MMVSRTADPNAPPSALAENARPVAVERYACGAVNWTRATSKVRGPDWPIPAVESQLYTHLTGRWILTNDIEANLRIVHAWLNVGIAYCSVSCQPATKKGPVSSHLHDQKERESDEKR